MLFKFVAGVTNNILVLFCIAGFILCIESGAVQAATDKMPELKVGYIPIVDAAQLYVAKDLNLFRKHGINVKLLAFAGGAKIIQALSVGELDVGFTGTVPLIQANSRGLPIRAITGGSIQDKSSPYQALVTPKNSSILQANQLVGATIGVNVFKSIDHSFTLAWLQKHGIDTKSIKFVEIPFPEMEAALTTGQIQAASMIEPFITLAEGRDSIKILDYHIVDVKPEFEMTTYVVSADYADKDRKELKAFQAAINEATDLINSGKANLQKSISTNTKLDKKLVRQIAVPRFGKTLTLENLEFTSSLLMKLGFIEKSPKVEDLILTLD
jgi:NitT/TauT family transport system substrate-binding protein